MPKLYGHAENFEEIANSLIPPYHPELATARIQYIVVDKGGMKGGRPVLGKVRKISGALEYLLEIDFLVEIAGDSWNELSGDQRQALADHLLERCYGEEDDESGAMKWSVREPDVQEFTSILRRRGVWTAELTDFVSVAKTIDLDAILDEVTQEQAVVTTEE
jgi:hypothetical protein